MAGDAPTIIVAQAEGGDALQQGVVVPTPGSEPGATTETHATTEQAREAFPPFDSSSFANQLIWLAVTFVILYVALSRVALPRVGSIIDARRTRIEGDLKEAERLRQETDKAVTAYETALAEARKNARTIADETRESIRADIDNKRKAVERDLSARIAEADARIQQTKGAALANVDSIAAETAQALVAQLTGTVSEAEAAAAVAEAKGKV